MARTIVICSDGTGNSFRRQESNVARFVQHLALDDHDRQVVVYDQGIGADDRRWQEIEQYANTVSDRSALEERSSRGSRSTTRARGRGGCARRHLTRDGSR